MRAAPRAFASRSKRCANWPRTIPLLQTRCARAWLTSVVSSGGSSGGCERSRIDRALILSSVRLAIIGDTHLPKGRPTLPEACVEVLESAELILHTGDFVGVEVLRELERHGEVVAVHGNVVERVRG